jgi:tetratricopeptide (TPR) repeat protein
MVSYVRRGLAWTARLLPQDSIRVYFAESRDGTPTPLSDRSVVLSEGRPYQVRIVDFDILRDLAVLQVVADLPADAEALPLAAASCERGDTVFSMGNPEGRSLWAYKEGTVESTPLYDDVDGGLRRARFQCIATSEPTWHGDSGGPVVNESGEIVAVTDAVDPHKKMNDRGQTEQLSQTAIAIDVSEVRAFLDEVRPLLHPKTADDYKRRGLRYLSRNRSEEALHDFEEGLKRVQAGADKAEFLFNRAKAYARRGLYNLVLKSELEKSIETGGGNKSVQQEEIVRGYVNSAKRYYEKAIEDLSDALDLKPRDPEMLIYRGAYFYMTGEPLTADADFKEAIRLAADKPAKREVLAEAYFYRYLMLPKQDRAGQIDLLTQAIQLDPRGFRYHLYRGARLMDLGEYRKGLTDAEKALAIAEDELDPAKFDEMFVELGSAHLNRGNCLFRLHRLSEVLERNKTAREIIENEFQLALQCFVARLVRFPVTILEARHLVNLARGYYYIGSFDTASQLFSLAEKLKPEILSERPTFREREFIFVNKTQANVVVYVKYHTQGKDGSWQWLPSELPSADWGNPLQLKAGQASFLLHDNSKIHADKVHMVVHDDQGNMVSNEYLAKDLDLVTEPYKAWVRGQFTFTLTPNNP